MGAEARLKELEITLPTPAKPVGNYIPGVRVGNLLFLSGHGPVRIDGAPTARGKVGRDLSTEEAYKVARDVGLNLLGSARHVLGSLDKVKRVVKVLGMVNAVEGFGEQPFGPDGRGVRRKWPPRPLGGGHGLAAHGHSRRDRNDPGDRVRRKAGDPQARRPQAPRSEV